jgi:uncharacterized protein YhbP (UPF0306 family)
MCRHAALSPHQHDIEPLWADFDARLWLCRVGVVAGFVQNCAKKGGDMDFEGLRGLGAIEDFAVQRPDFATKTWVQGLIKRNRVVMLATTDGAKPWVAPLEYMADEDLNLYFFSPTETRHAQHLEANSTAAATVIDYKQPIVTPTATVFLNGVQMECTATRIPPELLTDALKTVIETADISIPPNAAFKIVPHRIYVPKFQNGIHTRIEVDIA